MLDHTKPLVFHRGWTIHERIYGGGFDAFNLVTGQWFNRPTLRQAKWLISVHSNFTQGLQPYV